MERSNSLVKEFLKLYVNHIGAKRIYAHFIAHDYDARFIRRSKSDCITLEFNVGSFDYDFQKSERNNLIIIFKKLFNKLNFVQSQELSTRNKSSFCWMYVVEKSDNIQFKKLKEFVEYYRIHLRKELANINIDETRLNSIIRIYEDSIENNIRINKSDLKKEINKEIKNIHKQVTDFFNTKQFDLSKVCYHISEAKTIINQN